MSLLNRLWIFVILCQLHSLAETKALSPLFADFQSGGTFHLGAYTFVFKN